MRQSASDWAGGGHVRWPCVGLALAAMLGIAAAAALGASVMVYGVGLVLVGMVWLVVGRASLLVGSLCVLTAVALFFAAWYGLLVRQSPGRMLAEALAGKLPAPVAAEGVVVDDPVLAKGNPDRATMIVKLERLEAAEEVVFRLPARVRVAWEGEAVRYGDRVRMKGRIEEIAPPRNPGEFDAAGYYAGRGIFHQIILRRAWEGEILDRRHGNVLSVMTRAARSWMLKSLARGIEDAPDVVGVIGGMVLGERGDQSPAMRRIFRETGTLHLFAVSGLHVWMFGLLAWVVIRTFLPEKRKALIVLIPLLIFYAAVTGFRPSVVRATIMAVVVLGSLLVERPSAMPNTLAAAAFLILGMSPGQFFDLGFQLSFCVVGAIALLAGPLQRLLGDWWVPDPFIPKKLLSPIERIWQVLGGKVTGLIATTFAAWIGSMPLVYAHFHLLSPIALVANMVAVAIGFGVLGVGLLSILLALVVPSLSVLANNANWVVASLLLGVVNAAWHVPAGYFYLGVPFAERGAMRLTVFDFADGGAVHIESGGRHFLIDAGSARNAESALSAFLRGRGVRVIDEIVMTHGDSHHIGGIPVLLDQFRVRSLSQPMVGDRSSSRRRVLATAIDRKVPVFGRKPGDFVMLSSGACLHFLDPPILTALRKADDAPLVVRVESENWRILYLGDAGFPSYQRLAEDASVTSLQADIVVLGWNQSDAHGCLEFLSEHVKPRLVVLGRDPFARDPSAADWLIKALGEGGVSVMDQRRSGAVTLSFQPGTVVVREMLTGRTETLSEK